VEDAMSDERIGGRDVIRRLRTWLARETTREMLLVAGMLVTFPLFKIGAVRLAQLLFRLFGAELPAE
jgi:hypothetical protein